MILKVEAPAPDHPTGIYNAVCVDVIDLGMQPRTFDGVTRNSRLIRLVFETEISSTERGIIGQNFTASMHPKARLTSFLTEWRGRPYAAHDTVDTTKLVGASCSLMIDRRRSFPFIAKAARCPVTVLPSGQYTAERAALERLTYTQSQEMSHAE
ncbi:MAG TPA: hypothetical protein PK406_14980 [Verrucomicrobiota bacterium]|nr:hypothetical protein [Verrucomicrobiota bacterium]